MDLSWLENLTKPFSQLLSPIAERIGNRLGRRKPRLYVHLTPTQAVWCIARHGERDGSFTEMMQATFWADLNHDDPKETLVIVDAYPSRTQVQVGMLGKFAIPPKQIVHQMIAAIFLPIKGERGKPWSGRFILVDQFQRKHQTKKIMFRWAGPSATQAQD